MQLDCPAWVALLLNFTIILTFTWVNIRFLRTHFNCYAPRNSKDKARQVTYHSPVSLFLLNKYLVIRRMLKQKNDDDPPLKGLFSFVN